MMVDGVCWCVTGGPEVVGKVVVGRERHWGPEKPPTSRNRLVGGGGGRQGRRTPNESRRLVGGWWWVAKAGGSVGVQK